MKHIHYDKIADSYDLRYRSAYRSEGIASKLSTLIKKINAKNVLEVGCGTGHWLEILHGIAQICGIDSSFGMLQKASQKKELYNLVQADAGNLPFGHENFDLIFCVHALHHFQHPAEFISYSYKMLRKNGAIAVIGMNPHTGKDRWFVYDYFPGTYETDLKRFPPTYRISEWMKRAGFQNVSVQLAERIMVKRKGKDVLALNKDFTSQLSLLSQKEFENGMKRIKSAVCDAKASKESIVFSVDISLMVVKGRKRE